MSELKVIVGIPPIYTVMCNGRFMLMSNNIMSCRNDGPGGRWSVVFDSSIKYSRILTLIIICTIICGCNPRRFNKSPHYYTSYEIGQKYELLTDLLVVRYNYLEIPLAKPGVQMVVPGAYDTSGVKMEVIARLAKGDQFIVKSYNVEGGWMTHGNNWLYSNPWVKLLTGEYKNKYTGISLVSNVNDKKKRYFDMNDEYDWHFLFQEPDDEIMRLIHSAPNKQTDETSGVSGDWIIIENSDNLISPVLRNLKITYSDDGTFKMSGIYQAEKSSCKVEYAGEYAIQRGIITHNYNKINEFAFIGDKDEFMILKPYCEVLRINSAIIDKMSSNEIVLHNGLNHVLQSVK